MSHFRKPLVVLHLVGAVISIALLVSTFLAKGVIISAAQRTAVEKTRSLSDPLAIRLKETLDSPTLGKVIRGKTRERLEKELADYQASPDRWLDALVNGGAERAKAFEFPEIRNAIARKSVDAVAKGVAGLKDHMENSYRSLVFDIRLFFGTNVVAFLIAARLAWLARTPRTRHWLLPFSWLMLLMTAISIFLYTGQNWTWSLLSGNYIGWGYPLILGMSIAYGFFKVAPDLASRAPAASPNSPNS
ncbi:hypothetical protein [Luteolibacter marinus]|uniref:hypothetical protein n=1 Tax=Luteolibacter marinus TaxID=2776705 RepID=UPI0018678A37|nr:hypothetical protein [Luteolibacter marinus]